MKRAKAIKTYSVMVLLLGCVIFVQTAVAKSVNMAAGGDLSYKQAEIGFIDNVTGDIINKEPDLLTLNAFFAMAVNRFYFKVNIDQSMVDDEESSTSGNVRTDDTISRFDFGLTFGFNITKEFSAFGGLFYGETDWTTETTDTVLDEVTSEKTLSMSEVGPFLGLNYTFYFPNNMSLSLNGAYALMSGEQSWSVDDGTDETQYEGDTTGLSAGIKFSGPIGRIASYNIGYKTIQYKFAVDNSSIETDENFQVVSGGVSFYF